jgi:NitT/TauT family transport system ATP-binding protein
MDGWETAVTNTQKPALVQAEQVSFAFADGTAVLRDISLTIPSGAFVALVGSSGVGKSTLLRLLAGLLLPTTGQVTLDGEPSHTTSEPKGIVFQKDNLMPWRTAYENVRLPLELQGMAAGEAHERVMRMLALVGLQGFEQSYPAQLSGGMAQRVAIARALVHEPSFLLLDEPFGALDALTRERMGVELLRIWQAVPVTVLLVTHSIPEAVLLSDEVLVLNGRPATITDRIPVMLPRPRNVEIQSDTTFLQCAKTIRAAIKNGFK